MLTAVYSMICFPSREGRGEFPCPWNPVIVYMPVPCWSLDSLYMLGIGGENSSPYCSLISLDLTSSHSFSDTANQTSKQLALYSCYLNNGSMLLLVKLSKHSVNILLWEYWWHNYIGFVAQWSNCHKMVVFYYMEQNKAIISLRVFFMLTCPHRKLKNHKN